MIIGFVYNIFKVEFKCHHHECQNLSSLAFLILANGWVYVAVLKSLGFVNYYLLVDLFGQMSVHSDPGCDSYLGCYITVGKVNLILMDPQKLLNLKPRSNPWLGWALFLLKFLYYSAHLEIPINHSCRKTWLQRPN